MWTEADLKAWQAELDATDWPEWRKDMHAEIRRVQCPTYSEAREDVRASIQLSIESLRRLQDADCPPGWLTPKGIANLWTYIRSYRVEHTSLIRVENNH